MLLRGNAADVVQARKSGAWAAPKTTVSVYGRGMSGSTSPKYRC